MVPDESRLSKGDWLIVPDWSIDHQKVKVNTQTLTQEDPVEVTDPVPVQTGWTFYGTATGVPFEHRDGPRVRINIYRVTEDFIIETPP